MKLIRSIGVLCVAGCLFGCGSEPSGETDDLNVGSVSQALVPGIDFIVTSVSSNATPGPSPNTLGNVRATVMNQGTSNSSSTMKFVKWYLSADATLGGDYLLSCVSQSTFGMLASGASVSLQNKMCFLPAGVPAGSYYLLGFADATNSESESNETNNVLASAMPHVVIP